MRPSSIRHLNAAADYVAEGKSSPLVSEQEDVNE